MKPLWRMTSILLAALALHAGNTLAQSYPNKPVRIVVPFPPGGTTDVLARLVAPKLTGSLGQPIVVDNRGGAGGAIGTNVVAKAEPDGYTMLLTPNGLAVAPAVFSKLPYDPANDFIPVVQLISTVFALVANPSLPASNVKELIALAKSKPGSLNYGGSGITDILQLTFEMLKLSTGMDIVAVVYKGVGPLNTALLAGEVSLAIVPSGTAVPSVKTGRLRALGVTSLRRAAVLPEVPTIAEAGVPGFESTGWQGFFVPAKTPRAIVERLNRESVKAISSPDVRERLLAAGQEPVGGTPEEFDAKFRADLAKFAKIVKDAHIPFQD